MINQNFRMVKLAFWARTHVWPARLIIIFLIYPLLNIIGWFLGDMLALNGIYINQAWGYVLSFFILFLFLIYPFNVDKHRYKFYYTWKKSTDVLMILTTFCFILMRGNGFNSDSRSNVMITSGHAASVEKNIEPTTKKLTKEKKNFIKKFVKKVRDKYKKASKRDQGLMIALAIIVGLLLIGLLGALTCSIACSGAEGLAYVVFFLGLGGIIFGLVRVIQRIQRGKPRERKKEPQEGV